MKESFIFILISIFMGISFDFWIASGSRYAYASAMTIKFSRRLIQPIPKNLKRTFSTQVKGRPPSPHSSSKSKSKFNSKPKTQERSKDFYLSSFIAGIALASTGYYYSESQNFQSDLIRTKLLSGELEGKEFLGKVKNAPDLFNQALERKNEYLCILILRSSLGVNIDDADDKGNLLVTLIDNNMIGVIDYLLSLSSDMRGSLKIDSMDPKTGKTPLLAALQSRMYKQARVLLKMGAKPIIPATLSFPKRDKSDFLKELDQSEEAKLFLKDFNAFYGEGGDESDITE